MAYLGKTIMVEPLLEDLRRAARSDGFSVHTFGTVEGLPLLALERRGASGAPSIYLSAGIHGDEPAGPLAVFDLLTGLLPREITWTICPLLNPTGLRLRTRNSAAGVDLNRDYLALSQPETRGHVGWLRDKDDFDLALFLHEDWEASGFYVYELNPAAADFSLARRMIEAAERHCPVDHSSTIDGHDAAGGVITPRHHDLRRADWPEALYIFTHHNHVNYTLEAPSSFGLHTRVEALREAVLAGAEACLNRVL
jgi:murein peptide amidase A